MFQGYLWVVTGLHLLQARGWAGPASTWLVGWWAGPAATAGKLVGGAGLDFASAPVGGAGRDFASAPARVGGAGHDLRSNWWAGPAAILQVGWWAGLPPPPGAGVALEARWSRQWQGSSCCRGTPVLTLEGCLLG